MTPITVYHQELGLTLAAIALKIVENKAVILLQDKICVADFIDGIWTISSANSQVLDLCDIMWMRIVFN